MKIFRVSIQQVKFTANKMDKNGQQKKNNRNNRNRNSS